MEQQRCQEELRPFLHEVERRLGRKRGRALCLLIGSGCEAVRPYFFWAVLFFSFRPGSDNLSRDWFEAQQSLVPKLLLSFPRIIELCHQFPHGITDQVIQNDMPHMEAQQRAMAINRLLSMVGCSPLPRVASA